MGLQKTAKTFRLGLKQTGLAKKIRRASTIRLASVFVHRRLRQCSRTLSDLFSYPCKNRNKADINHRCAGSTRIHRIHPDPPGGSAPLFRIHRKFLHQSAEKAFWATLIYIILIVWTPWNNFRILWGAGGAHSPPSPSLFAIDHRRCSL